MFGPGHQVRHQAGAKFRVPSRVPSRVQVGPKSGPSRPKSGHPPEITASSRPSRHRAPVGAPGRPPAPRAIPRPDHRRGAGHPATGRRRGAPTSPRRGRPRPPHARTERFRVAGRGAWPWWSRARTTAPKSTRGASTVASGDRIDVGSPFRQERRPCDCNPLSRQHFQAEITLNIHPLSDRNGWSSRRNGEGRQTEAPPRSDPRGLRRFSPEVRVFRARSVLQRRSRARSQRAPSEHDQRRVGQRSPSLSCPVGREKPRGV